MTPDDNNLRKIKSLFCHDGEYHFSRWNKSIVPVIFGTDDDSLTILKDAFAKVISYSTINMADFDPELGANFMIFFCKDWKELEFVQNLNQILPKPEILLKRLQGSKSNQYRLFRFTKNGSINFCIQLLKYDHEMSSISTYSLGLNQILKSIVFWSPTAFDKESPIEKLSGCDLPNIRPFFRSLITAAYDPVLPNQSRDEAHALRLLARSNLINTGG